MLLIYGDHVIQQFAAAAADPALGDTVLPRTSNCRSYSPNAHRANRGGNFAAALGIVIQDKKLDWRLGRERFAQHLGVSGVGGEGGKICVWNWTPSSGTVVRTMNHRVVGMMH